MTMRAALWRRSSVMSKPGGGAADPALAALDSAGWIAPGAVCVIEIAAREPFAAPLGFDITDERRYGAARIVILRRA